MKVVIAPDSFKGCLGALGVAQAMANGVHRVLPDAEVVLMPVADGGEGTVDAFLAGAGGHKFFQTVTGPLGRPVEAFFGVLADGTGVLEMAAASGLPLVGTAERNPLVTTTRGTGELVKAMLDWGCRRLVLGIGGSATNDGGVGLAQALGWSFRDAEGRELGPGGGTLGTLATVDGTNRDPRLAECELVVASDVTNPLVGPQGASAIYGPQKGASPAQVSLLDANLTHLADLVEAQLGYRVHDLPGGGAAGGLGAGLIAFCGARLESGIHTVLDTVGFNVAVGDADLVLTGEGRLDSQSVYGKVPVGVAERAKAVQSSVLVVALAGGLGEGASEVYNHGLDAVFSIAEGPITLEESQARAAELLANAAERVLRLLNKCKINILNL